MRVPRPERRAALVAALLATAALAGAPAAQADAGARVIAICVKNQLPSGFSQAAYSQALKELTATAEEYSDCLQLIHQAQTAAASRHPGSSASGGGGSGVPLGVVAATPTEQRAIARAQHSGGGPVSLGNGEIVHPGVVHADIASAFSTLPAPLLAVLALMLAGALVLLGAVVRKRTRGERAD
jgi:hypothetical protein